MSDERQRVKPGDHILGPGCNGGRYHYQVRDVRKGVALLVDEDQGVFPIQLRRLSPEGLWQHRPRKQRKQPRSSLSVERTIAEMRELPPRKQRRRDRRAA